MNFLNIDHRSSRAYRVRPGVAALAVLLALGAAAGCNRTRDDGYQEVGRGPGDEAAQRRDMDPSVAQPGGPNANQQQDADQRAREDQNTQGTPGANDAQRTNDSGNARSATTLGSGAGGSGTGGHSGTGGKTSAGHSKGTGGSRAN
jgi:hypothetical protein